MALWHGCYDYKEKHSDYGPFIRGAHWILGLFSSGVMGSLVTLNGPTAVFVFVLEGAPS